MYQRNQTSKEHTRLRHLVTWITTLAFCLPLVGGCYSHAAYVAPSEMPKLNTAEAADHFEGLGGTTTVSASTPVTVKTTDGTTTAISGKRGACIELTKGSTYDYPSFFYATYDNDMLTMKDNDGYKKSFNAQDIKHVDVETFSWGLTMLLSASIVGGVLAFVLVPDWENMTMD